MSCRTDGGLITDGVLVLFPKALLSTEMGQTVFKNNSKHML